MDGRETNNTTHIGPGTHHLVYHATLVLHGDTIRHGIYAESVTSATQPNGSLFHLNGIPSAGPMSFRWRLAENPLLSEGGKTIRRVGWVFHKNHLERIKEVCEKLPRPGQRGREFPGSCEEWTGMAIDELFEAGILLPLRPEDPTDTIYRPQFCD